MKKYKEKKVRLNNCTCKFLNDKREQVYLIDRTGYSFKRNIDAIIMSFFLDKKTVKSLKKIDFKTIKITFDYVETMLEIKPMSVFIFKLLNILYFIIHKVLAIFLIKKSERLVIVRKISKFNKKFILNVDKFLTRILKIKRFKVLSSKNNQCVFEVPYKISKDNGDFTSNIAFKYDFNDIYYLNSLINEKGVKEIIKLPNILTKKTNEQI